MQSATSCAIRIIDSSGLGFATTQCRRAVVATAFVLAVAPLAPTIADDSNSKTADGLSVYLGVLPAAMVQGHPRGHAEQAMHGGVPAGAHAYHVIVAVFDSATGERVEDVVAEARVSPLGLAGVSRRLEPMKIAGTITFGNYFNFSTRDTYRIAVSITRPAASSATNLEFSYEHE